MGFLSALGKIAPFAASFIPGVGPALSPALGAIGAASQVGGKQAAGAAEGRIREADLLQRQDQLRNSQYGTQQGAEMNAGQLDLQRKGFTEGARGSRAKQAFLADLLGNYQPTRVSVKGVPEANISGGPQIGAGGKQAMAELSRQALLAQLTPDKFEGGNVLAPPELSTLPQAGKFDTTRSALSQIGQVGGALAPFLSQGQSKPSVRPQAAPVAGMAPDPQTTAVQENLKRLMQGVRF